MHQHGTTKRWLVGAVTAAAVALVALTPMSTSASAGSEDVGARAYPMQALPAQARRVGPADQLVSATATFTTRAVGMPRPGTRPDQQVLPGATLDISYGYHWETGAVTYHYEVRPTSSGLRPDGEPADFVGLGLGVASGSSCVLDTASYDSTSRFFPDRLVYGSGDATQKPNAGRWDCAVLLVENEAGSVVHDAFVSPLTVTTTTPQLTIKAPRKDRLVKGVWTRIRVKVANDSPEGINTRDAVLTGSGKGIKVRRTTVGSLAGQDDTVVDVWAKLTRPGARLRLAVREMGQVLSRASVKVRQRPAPPPPRAGKWSSRGVDLTVRGGKVRGFRIHTQTRCGGYPDQITTTNNTYDFPTVRVPRNNEVVASDRGNRGSSAEYVVHLDLEFVSPTKAKGRFSYYGPARCVAIDGFTITRKR